MQKKSAITILSGIYFVFMVAATLFVPVKGTVSTGLDGRSDPDAYTTRGYFPIWELWELAAEKNKPSAGGKPMDTEVSIELNAASWLLQYLFITLMFVSLIYRVLRHYKREEIASILRQREF